jgi:hypothetical protein
VPFLSVQLQADGPILPFVITVTEERKSALAQAGQTVPAPVPVAGLISTGAAGTVIDRQLLRRLGLSPTGIVTFRSTQQGMAMEQSNTYDVALALGGPGGGLLFPALAVLEGSFVLPTYQAIIGRDVLARCRFSLDGPARVVSIGF